VAKSVCGWRVFAGRAAREEHGALVGQQLDVLGAAQRILGHAALNIELDQVAVALRHQEVAGAHRRELGERRVVVEDRRVAEAGLGVAADDAVPERDGLIVVEQDLIGRGHEKSSRAVEGNRFVDEQPARPDCVLPSAVQPQAVRGRIARDILDVRADFEQNRAAIEGCRDRGGEESGENQEHQGAHRMKRF
jgi:azurin